MSLYLHIKPNELDEKLLEKFIEENSRGSVKHNNLLQKIMDRYEYICDEVGVLFDTANILIVPKFVELSTIRDIEYKFDIEYGIESCYDYIMLFEVEMTNIEDRTYNFTYFI